MEPLDTGFLNNAGQDAPTVYGGFWIRAGALLIDSLILAPVTILLLFNNFTWKSLPLVILLSLVSILYKPTMEFLYGASVGKMAVKLKVVSYDLKKIDFTAAFLRNIVGIASGIISLIMVIAIFNTTGFDEVTSYMDYSRFAAANSSTMVFSLSFCIVYIVDVVFMFNDMRKRTLHDRIAGTFVVSRETGNLQPVN